MKKFKIVFLFILSLLLIGCTGDDNIEIFKFVNLEHEIHVGESINLQLTMGQYPEDAEVKYTFSESDIISFENGVALGLKEGEVEVTATVDNLLFVTTKVIVLGKEVDGLQIISETNTLYLGEELQLSVRIFPDEFSDEVTWTVENLNSDYSVAAEITPEGLLKALRGEADQAEIDAGGAKVRVVATSTVDTKVVAKKDFYIRYKEVTVLTLSAPDDKVEFTFEELDGVESIELETGHLPTNSYPVISYTSSDETVVMVDDEGVITFPETLKEGSATITVTTLDNKTASLTITILDSDESVEPEE
ncbi:MAG: hypothetical protein WC006_06400 [Bacilli bacterium]|nr:hypothetical protein [Bacilli bacterium]